METSNRVATQNGWYATLLDKVNELIRKFDLPEDIAGDIQRLTIEVARAQFKAGNNSGISWARRNPSNRTVAVGSPAAA